MQRGSTFYLAATLFVAGTIPAHANAAGTPGASAKAESQNSVAAEAEKKTCKRLEVSGSRLRQRVCLTKSQWKKVEADS
jgi:hypothetical protein